MERARTIWQELGLPPITPRQPWHGYSLGDWDAVWDTYASRAVTGKWEETGKETFAQTPRRPDAGNAGQEREGLAPRSVAARRRSLRHGSRRERADRCRSGKYS